MDDMIGAQMVLEQDLRERCPQIEIVGKAMGVVEAAKLIREKKPDVLFLDI